ncbi:hypothetical protein [Deinococcus sonorensis]|uniref:Uncharacterized protein n=2 Tax=Deinococcus sonorensis TaxID=309891 RepID=A0AAU7UE18_9DEIO
MDASNSTNPPTPGERLQQLNREVQQQQHRLQEARAREHVGAAGWAQTSLLEDIIRAGRQQLAATDALRQVMTFTDQELRSTPLAAGQAVRQEQEHTLREVVASGDQQLNAAHALSRVIQEALQAVTDTPLHDISAAQLRRIHGRVQQQIRALQVVIEAARAQSSTLEQLQALDEVSAAYSEQVAALDTLSAEEELSHLQETGKQVVERISELEDAGPARQLEALERIGSAAVQHVGHTDASPTEQVQTLTHLQEETDQALRRLREDTGAGDAPD